MEVYKSIASFVVPAIATWIAFELFEPGTADGIKATAAVAVGTTTGFFAHLIPGIQRALDQK